MNYRVRHVTRYAYGSPVDLASHMVHLRPRPLPGQQVLEVSLETDPPADRHTQRHDHFGNAVDWFFLDRPHAEFVVTMCARVDVDVPPPPEKTPAWDQLAAMLRNGGSGAVSLPGDAWQATEFVHGSPMAAADAEAGAYAAPSFPRGRPVLEGLLELTARIKNDFAFRSGVTHLGTTVGEVLRRREGVCQDFTHLMIASLRALGLPARYMSGYIRTRPPPGTKRRLGSDQSHAWVGGWLGPELGWVGLDPTNNLVMSNEHVVLGWGRDYSDISPVRGMILGGGDHSLHVSVDLEPDEAQHATLA